MNYSFQELPSMITVATNESTREQAKASIDGFLGPQGIETEQYFYFEIYQGGKPVSTIILSKVAKEPEKSKKFRTRIIDAGTYFVMELPHQEYVSINKDKSFDIEKYLKERGYQMAEFPLFSFAPDLGEDMIRVYIKVAKR